MTVTCVRVPVMVGHSEAVNIEFHEPLDEDDAREILRDAPTARIVICSALGQEEKVMEAMAAGARDYVTKPFTPDQLLSAVARALE